MKIHGTQRRTLRKHRKRQRLAVMPLNILPYIPQHRRVRGDIRDGIFRLFRKAQQRAEDAVGAAAQKQRIRQRLRPTGGNFIEQRRQRVMEKAGLFSEDYTPFRPLSADEEAFVKDTQRRCAEKSITLLRDKLHHFPLSPEKTPRVAVVPIVEFGPAMKEARVLETALTARGFKVTFMDKPEPTPGERKALYAENDLVLYGLFSRPFRPMGFLDYTAARAANLAGAFAPNHAVDKTVFVSFGSPYFGSQYLERAQTYVNAYSMLGCAVEGFVRAACGEVPFEGTSPVKP